MTEVAISFSDVARDFPTPAGPIHAVCSLSATIAAGEQIALMGPSGSGKSTLINLVAGLDRPTAGRIQVFGSELDSMSERELTAFRARCIGLVFQDPHLLPGISALENVMVARLPHHPPKDLQQQSRVLLQRLGLGDRLHAPPARLSGGERQRVGIARALIGTPKLLLADEPTGNLDERNTENLMELLQQIGRERDLTVVVATHDPLVAGYATRQIRLADGALLADARA